MHGLLLAAIVGLQTAGDPSESGTAGSPKENAVSHRTATASPVDLAKRARYRRAIERGSKDPAVVANLFYVDLRLRKDGEALAAGRRYVTERPNDELFRLDFAYELDKLHAPAAHAYFEQLAGSANRTIAQRAQAQLQALSPRADGRADRDLSNGYAALKRGDRSAAIDYFRRHVAAYPHDALALLNLAFAEDAAGDRAGSLAAIERYLALRPNDERAELQRAYELAALGRQSAANELFLRLAKSPNSTIADAAQRAVTNTGAGTDGQAGDYTMLAASYAALQNDDRSGAIAGFFRHLDSHPNDATVWLALSYAQAAGNDRVASLNSLDRYLALRPGDATAELQRAYDLEALGKHGEARTSYRHLATLDDPEIAAMAKKQLTTFSAQRPVDGFSQTWMEWDSRLRDTVYGVDANLSTHGAGLQPYTVFHLSNDTRSSLGPEPAVFNDNGVIAALGLRAAVLPSTFVYAEGGEFVGLLNQGAYPSLRVGIAYHGDLGQAAGPRTSFDVDVSHYSYYSGDLISYATARHLLPIDRTFAILVGSNVGLDSHALYYNNFLEGLAGVQISTPHIKLRLAQVYGTYVRALAAPASHYWTFRPTIYYDAHL